MLDRTYYAQKPTRLLQQVKAMAEDTASRAMSTEAYMRDMFKVQEVSAVLQERGADF